ncbi:hypothetical protein D3C84_858090 [compost metagenome]
MVATQLAITLMHRHARIAALALGHPAAVVTQQGRRETSAIEEHQYLLARSEGLTDSLLHRPGYAAVQRTAFHIQTQEPWLFRAAGTLVQSQQAVTSDVSVMQAFQ